MINTKNSLAATDFAVGCQKSSKKAQLSAKWLPTNKQMADIWQPCFITKLQAAAVCFFSLSVCFFEGLFESYTVTTCAWLYEAARNGQPVSYSYC